MQPLRQEWLDLLGRFGVPAPTVEEAFADLAARYGERHRSYHTLDHVADVLARLHQFALPGSPTSALLLAAWLHDVVYDPRASDNEERSAEHARGLLASVGLPAAVGEETCRLILLTRTHHADHADCDGLLLLDADLAVLGREPLGYDRYAAAIREEYAWVPQEQYRAGRARVLRTFLQRPHLFHTPAALPLERPARANLAREIASLGG